MVTVSVNYCMKCGSPLEMRSIDGVERKACISCDYVFWGNYSIGVGGLVMKDGRFLLVKRAHDPGKGYWTNPGGYIEQLESIEETVEREVEEEAGIKAKVNRIVAIRDLPRQVHNIYVAFAMDYIDGTPTPDGIESDEAGFYSLDEIERMNVAPFTKWLINIAYEEEKTGLFKDLHTQMNDHILYKINSSN